MFKYPFENLSVWQESKEFALLVYQLTKRFPSEEKYGMVSQLRRAATSVCSNIAEGSARRSPKDQAHFYNTASASLMEVLSESLLSHDLNWIQFEDMETIRRKLEIISLKLNRLIKSCIERASIPKT